MARRRPLSMIRRRRSSTRSKGDWVYRANTSAAGAAFASDNLGSYDPAVTTVNAGVLNGIAKVLYDSSNYLNTVNRIGAGGVVGLGAGSSRASGRRSIITQVRGFINLIPTTWALGQVMGVRWRILAAPQDATLGFVQLDTSYTAWGAGVGGLTAAFYRNQARCLAEGTLLQAFASANDAAMFNLGVRWSGRWRLAPEDGLFLYVETAPTSVNARCQFWCSTRVIAGGGDG